MRYSNNFKSFRIIFLLTLLLNIGTAIQAQQDPYYSQFMFNKLTFNPAFTGQNGNDRMCATFVTKKQWLNLLGAPFAQNININAGLGANHGLGFVIENDILGLEKRLNFNITYAYRIALAGQQTIAIGASGGIYQVGLEGDKLKPLSVLMGGAPDPNLPNAAAVGMKTDFAGGVYYTKQNLGSLNDFYVGLSARHLTQPTIEYQVNGGASYNVFKVRNHVYIMAGAEKAMGNGATLKPSVMIRYDLTKIQFELNANYMMANNIWAGASYRNDSYRGEAFILQGGYVINKNLKAGVAYDFTLNRLGPLRNNSAGSFELMVQYCMKVGGKKLPMKKYLDTRRMGGWEL